MLIDLSLRVSISRLNDAAEKGRMLLSGHLGTHFDVMDKVFPLPFVRRKAIVFDVSTVTGRDISMEDIDPGLISSEMFTGFYTGFVDKVEYGSAEYFTEHPQLSDALIDILLNRNISIIGIDCAGVRRGEEHSPKDQYCIDRGVFIVENLCNLDKILQGQKHRFFTANTYPVNFEGLSGLPCRVVGEV